MENGIKIETAEITKLTVDSIIELLNGVRKAEFGDSVAIQSLKVLGKSASQPITISGCSINSGDSKFYKGSIVGEA